MFVSLLPYILLAFVKFEGLIEIETMQHPSLFTKLASFTIIQTFFISTIAGTLFASIQDIIENPTKAVADLASALPEQSAYFIQIIIVQNLPPLGIELLRISPIVQNILRGIVSNRLGHNLTEKERTSTFMGLRSLNDPLEYYFGRELGSKTILAMMTLYVYGSGMAPITSYFTLIVFGFLAIGFRHQFIYIYPIGNVSLCEGVCPNCVYINVFVCIMFVYVGWVEMGVREISFKRSLGCTFSGLEEMCVNCKGGVVAELDTQFAHILCT